MTNKARNASGMKTYNRQLILGLIRKTPLSRAEISRITGLTRAAVTIITDSLVSDGLVMEIGPGEAKYGRKPILLEVNPNALYTIGLDISRSGCILGLVDLKGKVLSKADFEWQSCDNAEEALEKIADLTVSQIDKLQIPDEKILGMGISAPGPLDIYSGIILNPPGFDMWKDIDIVNRLKESFAFPVYLDNNSNALALAEKNYGIAMDLKSFMLLIVDTGVGAGIVIDNHIYRGVCGFGSEVGHTTVNLDGKLCKCGNYGCVEVYASMPAILKYAQGKNDKPVSWKAIVDGAISGDGPCTEIIQREAKYLAAGITNAMNLLELEAVILTGDVLYKPAILLDEIQRRLDEHSITRHYRHINVLTSSIKSNAQIISSSGIAMEKFFSTLPSDKEHSH